jgi:D-alanine-D-alanine ligase
MTEKKRVGVLCGGLSSEREVSLRSGDAVARTLADRGHDAVKIFVDGDLDLVLRSERIDVAYVALHGRYGEDGCVQGLLELRGIPYTGSGLLGSALALDKVKAKELFRLHNLPTAPYYVHRRDGGAVREQHGSFGYPAVVKPRSEGSSLGVRRVEDLDELESAVDAASRFGGDVLVERCIDGREVHVVVFGGRALGAAEILPDGPILDFAARSGSGLYSLFCPPRLTPERTRGLCTLASRAAQALEIDGLAEVDVLVSDLGNEYLLEVDSSPALGADSTVQRIAQVSGNAFGDLLEAALATARLHSRGRERRIESERRAIAAPAVNVERRAPTEPH